MVVGLREDLAADQVIGFESDIYDIEFRNLRDMIPNFT
jgi:hypothetical protein